MSGKYIQKLDDILLYYNTVSRALIMYKKSIDSEEAYDPYYVNMTKMELTEAFRKHQNELEKSVALNILSSVEGSFKLDYIIRTKARRREVLSKEFRKLYKKKQLRASLEDDILKLWKQTYPQSKAIISNYIGALKYRHWLAHGRYFEPKLGQKYDFPTIVSIAEAIYHGLPFYTA